MKCLGISQIGGEGGIKKGTLYFVHKVLYLVLLIFNTHPRLMLYLDGEEMPVEQDVEEELVTAIVRLEQTSLAQGVMCGARNEVEGTLYKVNLLCVYY